MIEDILCGDFNGRFTTCVKTANRSITLKKLEDYFAFTLTQYEGRRDLSPDHRLCMSYFTSPIVRRDLWGDQSLNRLL